jgi:quinol-cytochrome oxidoreductase complex cytochrome b subunit
MTAQIRRRPYNHVERWIEDRYHIMPAIDEFIRHPVPKHVHPLDYLGECTLFVFVNQILTGILLAMVYRPVAQTSAPGQPSDAYLSILNIMNSMPTGSFIRSMHLWGNYFMVVLVILHAMRGFYMGAYKFPREFTWVTGVGLLVLTLAVAFTGYLLPWDQKAFWATSVGIGIVETIPGVGGGLSLLAKGGPMLSGVTLQRFYAIHMLVLPALVALLTGVHILCVSLQGISAADGLAPAAGTEPGEIHIVGEPGSLVPGPSMPTEGGERNAR